jgi:hypothetical protein
VAAGEANVAFGKDGKCERTRVPSGEQYSTGARWTSACLSSRRTGVLTPFCKCSRWGIIPAQESHPRAAGRPIRLGCASLRAGSFAPDRTWCQLELARMCRPVLTEQLRGSCWDPNETRCDTSWGRPTGREDLPHRRIRPVHKNVPGGGGMVFLRHDAGQEDHYCGRRLGRSSLPFAVTSGSQFFAVDELVSSSYTVRSCRIRGMPKSGARGASDWTARAVDSIHVARTWQAGRGVPCPPVFGVAGSSALAHPFAERRPATAVFATGTAWPTRTPSRVPIGARRPLTLRYPFPPLSGCFRCKPNLSVRDGKIPIESQRVHGFFGLECRFWAAGRTRGALNGC